MLKGIISTVVLLFVSSVLCERLFPYDVAKDNIHITGCRHDGSAVHFLCSEKFVDTNFFDSTPSSHCDNIEVKKNEIEEINFHKCNLTTLPPDLFTLYSNVNHIKMMVSNLKTLSHNDLKNATKLQQLYAPYNEIKELPAFLFDGAPNIQYVDLKENIIIQINPLAFTKTAKLKMLDVSGNRIQLLPAYGFAGLRELCTMYLQNNQIERIDANTFAEANGIAWMDLSYNRIATVAFHSFDDLINLEFLSLSHNPIRQLDPELFARTTKMKFLQIAHTEITTIDFTMFSRTPVLTHLELSYNKLTNVNFDRSMPPMEHLYSLRLFGNQLRSLWAFLHKTFPRLKYLGLVENKFTCIYLKNFFDSSDWMDGKPQFTRPLWYQPNDVEASENQCFGYRTPDPPSGPVDDFEIVNSNNKIE